MRVLVCDDDAACRFTAKRLLTKVMGYTVVECEDGVEALELLDSQAFNLALIDINLPRLSGIDVIDAIRQSDNCRDMEVAVLSQERNEETVRRLVSLGVGAYLIKPLRESTVVNRLAPLANRSRSRSAHAPTNINAIRLSQDAPAMLVDGDHNFRHVFASVASRFGAVMEAKSGAAALALFRQSRPQMLFVGTDLGVLGAETLVARVRESEHGRTCRIIGIVDDSAGAAAATWSDTTFTRSFVPDVLAEQLMPLSRIPGPLAELEELVPNLRSCLTSAVVQVVGMMSGVAVDLSKTEASASPEVLTSSLVVTINARSKVAIELRVPVSSARDVSARMFDSDPAAIADDACLSTVAELANMVVGRLDCLLKERGLAVHCTLPETVLATDDGWTPPGLGAGFVLQFAAAEIGATFMLVARAEGQGGRR